jgi:hypothetical protein
VLYAILNPKILSSQQYFVSFPPLSGSADNFKQIEIDFNVPVLRFGTEFNGWVFNSSDPDQIRQSIDPGNATFRFSGDVLAVNTPVGGDLLVDVDGASGFHTQRRQHQRNLDHHLQAARGHRRPAGAGADLRSGRR